MHDHTLYSTPCMPSVNNVVWWICIFVLSLGSVSIERVCTFCHHAPLLYTLAFRESMLPMPHKVLGCVPLAYVCECVSFERTCVLEMRWQSVCRFAEGVRFVYYYCLCLRGSRRHRDLYWNLAHKVCELSDFGITEHYRWSLIWAKRIIVNVTLLLIK